MLSRRLAVSTGFLGASTHRRTVHDSLPKHHNGKATVAARQQAAQNALLHLNVMIDQGIEPDVLMYTDLIGIMGAAKLEWQAFKLFARLLEQGLKPLPETYLALQRATHPSREKVIADLERRILESTLSLPSEVAKREQDLLEAEERESDRILEALVGPKDAGGNRQPALNRSPIDPFAQPIAEISSGSAADNNVGSSSSSTRKYQFADEGGLPTMDASSPRSVMSALNAIEGRDSETRIARENQSRRPELTEKLAVLHEEELRILLAIHRQLRNGNRSELVDRVLQHVPASSIESMIHRRKRFFTDVGDALEAQLRQEQSLLDDQAQPTKNTAALKLNSNDDVVDAKSSNQLAAVVPSTDLSILEDGTVPSKQETITDVDRMRAQPHTMIAPWGRMNKPEANTQLQLPWWKREGGRSEARDEASKLEDADLARIYVAARTGTMEEIPMLTLRKYCRTYRLHWSRKRGPTEAAALVAWHIETFPPTSALDRIKSTYGLEVEDGVNGDAVEKRRRMREAEVERKGMAKTQEKFDALRLIAQRCGNAQIVDSARVSRAINMMRARAKSIARQNAEQTRQVETLARVRSLEESMQRMPPSDFDRKMMSQSTPALRGLQPAALASEPKTEPPRVLGLDDAASTSNSTGEDNSDDDDATESTSLDTASTDAARAPSKELPPWAVRTGTLPFNFKTGRFGNPDVAQVKERSDGTFGLSFSAQRMGQYHVDVETLPRDERAEVKAKLLQDELRQTGPEATAWAQRSAERDIAPKYQKLAALARRAKEKKTLEVQERKETEGAPVVQRRMAQVLKQGHDQPKAFRQASPPADE